MKNTYKIKDPAKSMIDYRSYCGYKEIPVEIHEDRVIYVPATIARDAIKSFNQNGDEMSATIIEYFCKCGSAVAWLSRNMVFSTFTDSHIDAANRMNFATRRDFLTELQKRGYKKEK